MRVLPNVGSFGPASPDEILRPAKPWFIVLSLLLGLAANLVPVSGVLLELRPDFLALVLLYWCIQQPRYVGVGTAWVVGQFHEISRRMRLPSGVAGQVPPIRLVSVNANINGGVKAAIRAETGDKAAADQLRDVVRGFLSLARLQAGGKQELENTLKSIELSGSDTTVRLSFAVSPETLRVIAPSRGRGNRFPRPGTPEPLPGK